MQSDAQKRTVINPERCAGVTFIHSHHRRSEDNERSAETAATRIRYVGNRIRALPIPPVGSQRSATQEGPLVFLSTGAEGLSPAMPPAEGTPDGPARPEQPVTIAFVIGRLANNQAASTR